MTHHPNLPRICMITLSLTLLPWLSLGCGGGGGGGGGEGTSTGSFQVTSHSPATPFRFPMPGEAGFESNSTIQIIFTNPIDPTTVYDGNPVNGLSSSFRFIQVGGARAPAKAFVGGYSASQRDDQGRVIVSPDQAVVLNDKGEPESDRVLTLIADRDGDLGTLESFGTESDPDSHQVTVVVGDQARDLGGNPITQGFCATYNVGLTTPNPGPRVVSITPSDGEAQVTLDSPVVITFSEEVDPASVIGTPGDSTLPPGIVLTGLQLQPGGTTGPVTVPPSLLTGTIRPTFQGDLCSYTFTPNVDYPGQTVITVSVRGSAPIGPNTLPPSPNPITDSQGTPLANTVSMTFITDEGPVIANNPTPPNAVYFGAANPGRFGVIAINAIENILGTPTFIVETDGDGVPGPEDDLVVVPNSENVDSIGSVSDIVVGNVISLTSVVQNDITCSSTTIGQSITGNTIDNPPQPNPPPLPAINSTSNCVPSLCSNLVPGLPPAVRPNASNADLGNYVYVADDLNNVVHVLNSTTSLPITQISTPDPTGLATDPDMTFLYVTNFGAATLSIIDIRAGSGTFHQVIREVAVGRGPRAVVVQPDNEDILIANTGSNTVSILSSASFTLRKEIVTGVTPWDIACTHRGVTGTYFAFISNRDSNSISIYESGPTTPILVGQDDVIAVMTEGPVAAFDGPMGIISNRRVIDPRVADAPGCIFVCNGNRSVAEIRLTAFQPPPFPGFPVVGPLRTFSVVMQTDPSAPENPIGLGPTDLALNDNVNPCVYFTTANTKAWHRFNPAPFVPPLLNECNILMVANSASGTVSVIDRRSGFLQKVIEVPGVNRLETYFK